MKTTMNILGISLLVLCALPLVPVVSANIISDETLIIESDSYKFLELEAKKGGTLEIDAKIIGEGAIDLFMMDNTNFEHYSSGMDYEFYEEGSALNIHTKKYTFEAPKSQTYYFILDNTEEGVAYTFAPVKVKIVISDLGTPSVGAFEVVLAFSAVFIIAGIKRRAKKNTPRK